MKQVWSFKPLDHVSILQEIHKGICNLYTVWQNITLNFTGLKNVIEISIHSKMHYAKMSFFIILTTKKNLFWPLMHLVSAWEASSPKKMKTVFYNPSHLLDDVSRRIRKNYSATERELLGVVYSVLDFRHYLERRHFQLYTDHALLGGSWKEELEETCSVLTE